MRKEKREITRSELQAKITQLQNRNRELFRFLEIDREKSAQKIREAQEGVQETMLAMNLVLGEVTRKYGEVTIPIPDITKRQYYNVERNPEKRTMTFRPVKTAENSTEWTEEYEDLPGNTKDSEVPETENRK